MTETICVDAGICKLRTVITPKMDDMGNMEFEVKSQCPNVTKMFAALGPVNAYTEVAAGFADSELYKKAAECIPHVACPVPCATVKAMEVTGGLALKREVSIRFLADGEDPGF